MGLLLLQWILGPVSEKRNWEFFPDMARSAAYGSQSSSPYFGDGMTQRQPESGTIARDHLPFLFGTSEEESERAGRVLESPFPPPSLLADTTRAMPAEGKMFHILTLGYRNMPPYGSLIDREDRWRVISHVRTLQESAPRIQSEDSIENPGESQP